MSTGNFYPFASEQHLRSMFLERVELLRKDRGNVLPIWAQAQADAVFEGKNLVICGSVSRSEIRTLARIANVIGIVDDYLVEKQNRLFGVPVLTSDEWGEMARQDQSIVSCILVSQARAFEHFVKLCTQWELQWLGPLEVMHLIKSAGVNTKGETGRFFWYGYEFFEFALTNADRLTALGSKLGDSFSRSTWWSVLLYRLTLNPFFLTSCAVGHHLDRYHLNSYSCNRQFFKFSDKEVYVDGGTFIGYTVEQFIRAVGGAFSHVYAFEPANANRAQILGRLQKLQDEFVQPLAGRVSISEKGLWNKDTTLLFNPTQTIDTFGVGTPNNTQSAHLVDSGILGHLYDKSAEESVAFNVPVTTIDNATDANATFIKLEIEGAELEALNGARKTIERMRPKMAISIYHKPEDLVTLTDFVIQTGQDYKLGFRQHNPMVPDAMVLYCY